MTTRTPFTFALYLLPLAVLFSGCNKNPFDRLKDGSGGGALGNIPTGSMVIFSDELKSGGGAFEYPSGDNQVLSFADRSNPVSQRSIRYSWNGQPVSNPQLSGFAPNPEFTFVGFDLMHTPTLATYATTPGRNLQFAGYTKVTFFIRGSLSTFTMVKIEVSEPATPSPPCYTYSTDGTLDDGSGVCTHKVLTGDWQPGTIMITQNDLAAVKDFFKATFVYNNPTPGNTAPGQGGIVYLDGILYQP